MIQLITVSLAWGGTDVPAQYFNVFCGFVEILKTSIGRKLQGFSLFLILQDDPFKMKSGGMVDMKKLKERGKDRWVHVSSEGFSLL